MSTSIPSEEIGIGIIFNKKDQILIDQRLENSSMGGMWEFPGGKRELNEKIEITIHREIMEELGISIKVEDKLLSFDHAYGHKRLFFSVYICKFLSGNPKPIKSQKLLWVYPERLFDFPFPAANTIIIRAIHKYLKINNSPYGNR